MDFEINEILAKDHVLSQATLFYDSYYLLSEE